MNIDQLLGTGLSNTSNIGAPKKELGQEDFLELLVAQMKNQDPSNPADNGEFLSQIAQFSMVSGIDDLGTSFNGVAGSLYSAQAMQAATLVGKEVLTESNSSFLTPGKTIDGSIIFEESTSGITLKVRNAGGELVDLVDLGTSEPGTQHFSWAGLDESGNPLPAGRYTFDVEGIVAGGQAGIPVQLFNRVQSVSVDRDNSTIMLHLSGQESVGLSQISEYK